MPEYEFTVSLNRGVTKAEIDQLYEAGLGDTGIETGPRGTLLDVTRDAWSEEAAIDSVRVDVARVPGLRVTSVGLVVSREFRQQLTGFMNDNDELLRRLTDD
jgi:hypothetical protein